MRDHSILNVIASVRGKSHLMGVVKMDACNHSTFSQAIIKAVSELDINFNHVISVVTDNASYCKKVYRDVLSVVYPNSLHVLCIAHIINLVSEVFHHHSDFKYTSDLISISSHHFLRNQEEKAAS